MIEESTESCGGTRGHRMSSSDTETTPTVFLAGSLEPKFGVTNPALLNVAGLRRDTSSLETGQPFA
jgi:hypothetical protein